jgi:NAD-dependent deacetylase
MNQHAQLPLAVRDRLAEFQRGNGTMVVLSGAGISAESGIPTFRGKEGYWVVGSREYQPQEMATHATFARDPEAVWAWYLYRLGVCRAARPNAGHEAVVQLERLLGDRFLLITQNVDGLHLRAGSSADRTYQIHGNIDFCRCDAECGQPIFPFPDGISPGTERSASLTDDQRVALRCPGCGGWARPHVLWFDEYYDEEHFRYESSLTAAAGAELLLVVGTSGATNLPMQVGQLALRHGATIIDVNPEPNLFSYLAEEAGGAFLRGPSSRILPLIVEALQE